jgi:tetratricopeptide (TPR) repeat protein
MAVFGVPRVREDDALRACRAALEMKRRLAELNDRLEQRYGVRLTNRTGVNTGELVSGNAIAGQRLLIGDVVNTAARLEQDAPDNEILIGERTYESVQGEFELGPVQLLTLKGKAQPVRSFQLLRARQPSAVISRYERPMIGREAELDALCAAVAETREANHGVLATLSAAAGMGKSRLYADFVERIRNDARVLYGRCLAYGRGVTFWPLAEMVRAAASITADDSRDDALAKLSAAVGPGGGEITHRIGAILGLNETPYPVEEIVWGARKFFERLALDQPLVVVFDDLHWAEPTLLALIRQVAESARAPVLVLAMTRPQLFEHETDWPQERLIKLDSLPPAAMALVLVGVLGTSQVTHGLRAKLLDAADGNPLFLEQMLSMLIASERIRFEGGRWRPVGELSDLEIPHTINGLLMARVEQLPHAERGVIEPAAIVGYRFARGAVEWLVDEPVRSLVPDHLAALCAKLLVRPDVDIPSAGDRFRFEHILIRDAVYKRLPKRRRATLHEQFVAWAEADSAARARDVEFDEILGYHLEQAHKCLRELGPLDDHGHELGRRAAARLSAAGHRAFARGDMPAAATLLRRCVALLPPGSPARLALLPDLCEALLDTGDFAEAEDLLLEAADGAMRTHDAALAARARIVDLQLKGNSADPASWAEQAVAAAKEIIDVFRRVGDDAGLASAYRLLAWAHGTTCSYGAAAQAAELALHHAGRAGDDRQRRRAASQYAIAALWGPTPVPQAIERCEEIIMQAPGDRRTEGLVRSLLGRLEGMRGDFDRGRLLARQARETLEDMGRSVIACSTSLDSCGTEILAGDPGAAVRDLQRDYAALEEMGEKYLLSTVAAYLAVAYAEQREDSQAAHYSELAERLTAEDDLATQAMWRWARARVLARRGRTADALALAREAVAMLDSSDSLVLQGDARIALAEVAQAAGRTSEAAQAVREALSCYERKGDVVSAARARALASV